MKKQIQPLSRTEIIKLDKAINKIRYAVKRGNIAKDLHAGYCKVKLNDFDNDKIVLQIESKVGDASDSHEIVLGRNNMEIIIFNPENN